MDVVAERFAVFLVPLDPGQGAEMRKTRPCVVVSPASMHPYLKTVVVVPLTSGRTGWPTRVPCLFQGRQGEIALDQIRCVDHRRLLKRMGRLNQAEVNALLHGLQHFFA